MNFPAAKDFIIPYLQEHLPENLHYHGLHHTLGVYNDAREIAMHENINGQELKLLLTAALFHDSGFTQTYQEHEEAGVQIARKYLPDFAYDTGQINHICDMIMATKIPQSPKDKLGKILCDADLFYLGGNQFYHIGNKLFKEFCERGIVCDEEDWNKIQLNFLRTHHYFTSTAIKKQALQKERHLHEIKEVVAGYAA